MKKLRFRDSLVTRIIMVFLVCNLISVLLFSYVVSVKERNKAIENTKSNLQEIVKEKSQLISINFQRIQNNTELLGVWYEKLLNDSNYQAESTLKPDYKINANGTITRGKDSTKKDVDQSAIFIANTVKKGASLNKEINLSEQLDKPFAEVIKNEDVAWAYLITKSNILRCSPYSDMKKQFKTNHNQTNDPFYIDAVEKNDPDRSVVWTKPYTDYLGKGWTMTCSKPIYKDNKFYGVICLDMSISNVKKKYFKGFSIGKTGRIYWLTKKGNIYYQSDMEKKTSNQGEIFSKNIFKEENMSSAKKATMEKALTSGSGTYTYEEKDGSKLLFCAPVKETDSVLIIETDESEFTGSQTVDPHNMLFLILLDLFISIAFITWLYYKFSKPMAKLVNKAKRISDGDYSNIVSSEDEESNVYEIAKLENAFSTMNASIEEFMGSLLEKNREISTILETVDGTLMIVDIEGNILNISKASEGVSEHIIADAIDVMKKERRFFSEQLIVGSDVFRNTYYPILNKNRKVEKMVVSSECITQSLLMEKEVQQIEKMAGIGQLSAAIVHELKNSLALIKGAAYILLMEESNTENLKEAKVISRAADEAEGVIDTLLDYSKGEDGTGQELIHVGTIIKQILLLSKKNLIKKNIKVIEDIDDKCYINSTSREALKVILQNIIINAIQAVDEDGIIVVSCNKDSYNAYISIKDNGPEIDKEWKEKIFEPFFTTKDSGNGIGLWITKRLVDSLGGKLELNEDNNKMTEFDVILPIRH